MLEFQNLKMKLKTSMLNFLIENINAKNKEDQYFFIF